MVFDDVWYIQEVVWLGKERFVKVLCIFSHLPKATSGNRVPPKRQEGQASLAVYTDDAS